MKKVLVPLAPGCEELEAVTIVDILRRGDVVVVTAGLQAGPIEASRGILLTADTLLSEAVGANDFDMVVIPGGMAGSQSLMDCPYFVEYLQRMFKTGRLIGAICAAPMILGQAGLLNDLKYTAYPGVISPANYPTAAYTGNAVEQDKNILTSRGPGTALDFALAILEQLMGRETRDKVEEQLVRT